MLSKRTVIGMVIGSIIIGIGGYSLFMHVGTFTIEENYTLSVGDSIARPIPAPADTAQHMVIHGESFDLRLESPGDGQQIPSGETEKRFVSFKDKLVDPLVLDWVHVQDGETLIEVQNTGSTEVVITGTLVRSFDPIWFTYDLMVIISGMVIIGFSMGFTLRRPKGF